MKADQARFDFPEPPPRERRQAPAVGVVRIFCARCHLPLDYDRRVDPGLFILNKTSSTALIDSDMCDTCRREYFGEGVNRHHIGVERWSGGRLALGRKRLGVDARDLGRQIKVAHTTIIRNERRVHITAYLTRKLVAWQIYDRLSVVTGDSAGGAGRRHRSKDI